MFEVNLLHQTKTEILRNYFILRSEEIGKNKPRGEQI